MPRSVALILVAGLLAFASPARAGDVEDAIEAANAKMVAEYAAGDSKAIAEAYTEDAVMLPPDATVVSGRAAIAKLWKGWIDDGLKDLTLTTNGSRLAHLAKPLKEAGLTRITVSLDSLDDKIFRRMNDVEFPVAKVLAGIEAAQKAGLAPIKVNTVVRRGMNEAGIADIAGHFRGSGITVRFIEFMDVGNSNGWRLDDVVPAKEIIETINRRFPLEPVSSAYRGEVAKRWRYKDGAGEVGVISSVTQNFCGDCTRIRLSADGRLYTCLFAVGGHDVRTPLRAGASDEGIVALLRCIWSAREDQYSELRSKATPGLPKIEMSYIGG